jgi:hypothetical protein
MTSIQRIRISDHYKAIYRLIRTDIGYKLSITAVDLDGVPIAFTSISSESEISAGESENMLDRIRKRVADITNLPIEPKIVSDKGSIYGNTFILRCLGYHIEYYDPDSLRWELDRHSVFSEEDAAIFYAENYTRSDNFVRVVDNLGGIVSKTLYQHVVIT